MSSIDIFVMILIFNTVGMFTSVVQKLTIFRVKDNVTLNITQVFLEFAIAIIGLIFVICYSGSTINPLISDTCKTVLPNMTADE